MSVDHLEPGMHVIHVPTGHVLTIAYRKEDNTGWWNTDGSGFSDYALTLADWEPAQRVEGNQP